MSRLSRMSPTMAMVAAWSKSATSGPAKVAPTMTSRRSSMTIRAPVGAPLPTKLAPGVLPMSASIARAGRPAWSASARVRQELVADDLVAVAQGEGDGAGLPVTARVDRLDCRADNDSLVAKRMLELLAGERLLAGQQSGHRLDERHL